MKKDRVCRADIAMYMWGPKAKVVLAADYNNALVRIAALEAKIAENERRYEDESMQLNAALLDIADRLTMDDSDLAGEILALLGLEP